MDLQTVYRRSFGRSLGAIAEAERWLDTIASEAQLSGTVAFAMQVCLEEVFANIVRHAALRDPDSQAVEIKIEIDADSGCARMTVEHEGEAFDIAQAPSRRITQSIEEIEPGGLGIVLIQNFSSSLSYRRIGSRDCVTLGFALADIAAPENQPSPNEVSVPANKALNAVRDALAPFEPLSCAPGEILMRQGEASEQAFLLEDGSVLVYSETSYGDVPLATLQGPRLIGEIGVLANLPRTASIRVTETAAVVPVSKAALLEIGEKAPELLLSVIAQLGRQIDSVNKAIGLYTNALSALEKREFDSGILADLKNPTPELTEFAATFRRFADQILDKRRQQDEMASAALIQQSLLPNPSMLETLDSVLDLYAEVRPARRVGGDFYDIFMLDPDRLAFAIGDVCGKGMPASLFMAIVVTVLRTAAREEGSVASAIARANAILCMENASSMFATVILAILNIRTGLLEYGNCGHNPPFILPADADPRALDDAASLPLALFPDLKPQVFSTMLSPGDALLLYTDGVTEATDHSLCEFGEERLQATLAASRNLPAKDLAARIFSSVAGFASGAEQSDDITCLTLRLAAH